MKRIVCLAIALVVAFPLTPVMGHATTWHDTNMKVIFNSGDTAFNIVSGSNTLDQPTSFKCGSSAGCVVSASSTTQTNAASGLYLCTSIDGVQANPACGKVTDLNDVQNLRQYASVTQGTHSIQTILYSYGNGGTVQAWETDYTIYIGK